MRFPAKPSPAAARIPPRAIVAIDASSPVSGSAGPLGASGVVGGVTGGTTGVGGGILAAAGLGLAGKRKKED